MAGEGKGKILIIEDAAGYRRIYGDLLATHHYEVIEANDGYQGLQLAVSEQPDLILLDIVLPGLSGFDVLRELRGNEATRSLPVIIASVLGEPKDINTAWDLGADDYTIKGAVSPRDVLRKIEAILGATRKRKQAGRYRLPVGKTAGDAAAVANSLGLSGTLACPECGLSIAVELTPAGEPGEHRFLAHFVCPKCEADI